MCGTAPKLHAPDSDGKSLCGAENRSQDVRVARTTKGFLSYPEIKGYFSPGYGICDNLWMGTAARCKTCFKKVAA